MKTHVVVGLLFREETVLLCQRKPERRYGLKWEFPGGKVEAGETPVQALERELEEELGIRAVVGSCYRTDTVRYEDGGEFTVDFYCISSFEGTIASQHFHDMQWVRPSEFGRFDILDGNREVCEQLKNHSVVHSMENC